MNIQQYLSQKKRNKYTVYIARKFCTFIWSPLMERINLVKFFIPKLSHYEEYQENEIRIR